MFLTGGQIRAARALLRWSAGELAEKSGVSLSTVQRGETAEGPAPMIPANMEVIRRALEAGGAEFIAENGGGAGVRERKGGATPPQAQPAAMPPHAVRQGAPGAPAQDGEAAKAVVDRSRALAQSAPEPPAAAPLPAAARQAPPPAQPVAEPDDGPKDKPGRLPVPPKRP